jgi:hypothetical protein
VVGVGLAGMHAVGVLVEAAGFGAGWRVEPVRILADHAWAAGFLRGGVGIGHVDALPGGTGLNHP